MERKDNELQIPDCLDHGELAAAISQIFESVRLPMNVLIFGDWGTGKTTLLANLHEYLQVNKADRFHVVHFNPWLYESNPNLLLPLLKTIHNSLPTEVRDDGQVKELIVSCLTAALDVGLRVASRMLSAGLLEMKLQDFKDALKKEQAGVLGPSDRIEALQNAFRDLVQRAVQRCDKYGLVVLLDDLDRCLPDNAIALVEGVKLYLSQGEGMPVIFVWAMDRDVISEAIGAKYGLAGFSGRDYLEKVFDFQIPVPRLTRNRHEKLVSALFECSQYQDELKALLGEDPVTAISKVLDLRLLRNPRTLNRIFSMLTILASNSDKVIQSARKLGLLDEKDPHLFARRLLVGLTIAYSFKNWRFGILHNRDAWPIFISGCNTALPESQDIIRQHRNLCVLLSVRFGVKFDIPVSRKGLQYRLHISNDHMEELYKISELLLAYAC